MRKIHLLRSVPIHGRADAIHVPARIIAQDPNRQIGGLFQPNATMAEVAPGLRKEHLLWSVVHVHVLVIREDKFHESDRALWTPRLPGEKLSFPGLLEPPARSCS